MRWNGASDLSRSFERVIFTVPSRLVSQEERRGRSIIKMNLSTRASLDRSRRRRRVTRKRTASILVTTRYTRSLVNIHDKNTRNALTILEEGGESKIRRQVSLPACEGVSLRDRLCGCAMAARYGGRARARALNSLCARHAQRRRTHARRGLACFSPSRRIGA